MAFQSAVIRTTGLERYSGTIGPPNQVLPALFGIWETPVCTINAAESIEPVLSDIAANTKNGHLQVASACHAAPGSMFPFRPLLKTRLIKLLLGP